MQVCMVRINIVSFVKLFYLVEAKFWFIQSNSVQQLELSNSGHDCQSGGKSGQKSEQQRIDQHLHWRYRSHHSQIVNHQQTIDRHSIRSENYKKKKKKKTFIIF